MKPVIQVKISFRDRKVLKEILNFFQEKWNRNAYECEISTSEIGKGCIGPFQESKA